jgi:hypothetical protein
MSVSNAPVVYRLTLIAFYIALAGVILMLIGGLVFRGWDAIGIGIWGMLVTGISLIAAFFCSLLCVITEPLFRKKSAIICILSVVPVIVFFSLFH